jgi:hypothetical protein
MAMVKLVTSMVLLTFVSACGALNSSAVEIVDTTQKKGGVEIVDTAQKKGNDGKGAVIARSQIWTQTNVRTMDIRTGPQEAGAFPFTATVTCDYYQKDLSGASPKFPCRAGTDELKVKYGPNNAEVFGEVAATRLMWALGFGADRMYSVKVVCRGCPSSLGGIARENKEYLFDPATVERKMPGRELEPDSSWSWTELDAVDEARGGAPVAHRDALKLLAVFLQHTDTKPDQQRIVCLGEVAGESATAANCARPLMMVSDVGLTFGRANLFNTNGKGMNYVAWAATPVWKEGEKCVGNLPKSLTGTLNNPAISEAGRAFLADLLMQLSDDQISALFEVARVNLRLRDPGKAKSGLATVDEWVDVFKRKRAEIVERRCA